MSRFSAGTSGNAQAISMPKGPTSRHVGGGRRGPVAASRKAAAPHARPSRFPHYAPDVRRHQDCGDAHCLDLESVLFCDIGSAAHEMHSARLSGRCLQDVTRMQRSRRVHDVDTVTLKWIGADFSCFAPRVHSALSTIRMKIPCAMILRKLLHIAAHSACFMLSTRRTFGCAIIAPFIASARSGSARPDAQGKAVEYM